jgi:plasmid maintenance system antidote protein VapI
MSGTNLTAVLQRAIQRSGMTVYRLAQQTDVPAPTLRRFLSGQRGMTLDTAAKLCRVLNLELNERKN